MLDLKRTLFWRRSKKGEQKTSSNASKRSFIETNEARVQIERMISDSLVLQESNNDFLGIFQSSASTPLRNVYGHSVSITEAAMAASAVWTAIGFQAAGHRSTAIVEGIPLRQIRDPLEFALRKRIPVVVHASVRDLAPSDAGHRGCYEMAQTGVVCFLPGDNQQLLLVSLLARWLAEVSLTPVLIVSDRRTLSPVSFPPPSVIRQFLGAPGEAIPTPVPSQLILFGSSRRRSLSWYDPDRPVTLAPFSDITSEEVSSKGQFAFFQQHLPDLLKRSIRNMSQTLQVESQWVTRYHTEDAEEIVFCLGSVFETARDAIDICRARGRRIGLVRINCLHPFPIDQIRSSLVSQRDFFVLECGINDGQEFSPLTDRLLDTVKGRDHQRHVFYYGGRGRPLTASELVGWLEGKERGYPFRPVADLHPRRQALLDATFADYPALKQSHGGESLFLSSEFKHSKSARWVTEANFKPLVEAARFCRDQSLPIFFASAWSPARGLECVDLLSGAGISNAPEAVVPIDFLILDETCFRHPELDPFATTGDKATILVSTEMDQRALRQIVPSAWQRRVADKSLKIYKTTRSPQTILTALQSLLVGGLDLPLPEVTLLAPQPEPDHPLPDIIRRYPPGSNDYAGLSRFWGEVLAPLVDGHPPVDPEPLSTVGAIPPLTASLARKGREQVPTFKPEDCTACGACWAVCPDSALGVSTLSPIKFLEGIFSQNFPDPRVSGALRRFHKGVATRLTQLLGDGKQFSWAELKSLYLESVEQGGLSPDLVAGCREYIGKVVVDSQGLLPAISEKLFLDPLIKQSENEELFFLAIDPYACQQCGICINACPEEALSEGDGSSVDQTAYQVWEQLPDTDIDSVKRIADTSELPTLDTLFLSRRVSQAQAPSPLGSPGSGGKLALRLTVGALSAITEKIRLEKTEELTILSQGLRQRARNLLSAELVGAELNLIEAALEGISSSSPGLEALHQRFTEMGQKMTVDKDSLLSLVQSAEALDRLRKQFEGGQQTPGRAGFGIVFDLFTPLIGPSFPFTPYRVPVLADHSEGPLEIVPGLVAALKDQYVSDVRMERRARLLASDEPGTRSHLRDLDLLSWEKLSGRERLQSPQLLAVCDLKRWNSLDPELIGRLFGLDFPLRILVIDDCDPMSRPPHPLAMTLDHPDIFIASSSIGHPDHLSTVLLEGAAAQTSTFIHVLAPEPSTSGLRPESLLEHTRQAVESRARFLFIHRPSNGARLVDRVSLEGNSLDSSSPSVFEWAMGDRRALPRLVLPDKRKGVPPQQYLRLGPEEQKVSVPVISDPSSGEVQTLDIPLCRALADRVRAWESSFQLVSSHEDLSGDRVENATTSDQRTGERTAVEKKHSIEEPSLNDSRMVDVLRRRLLAMAGYGKGEENRHA